MKKIFSVAVLALAVGGGAGYISRDIQAGHEMEAQKLHDVQRLREAYNCDKKPAGACTMLDFEREQIITGYSIGGTPG
jgi:hypothetical protein